MNIKSTLNRIMISRAFTTYQLTNFIVNEIPSLIEKYSMNLIAIPDGTRNVLPKCGTGYQRNTMCIQSD